MASNQTYTKELRENLNYTATWLPNFKLALGDVGVLSNFEFTYRTNLKNLGISYEEGPPGPKAEYTYLSAGSVTRNIKLSGKAPLPGSCLAKADAGVSFAFNAAEAVVFMASDCRIRSIVDQEKLRQDLRRMYDTNALDPTYVVITEIVDAGSASVVIAEGTDAHFELKAKAGLIPQFADINVAGSFSLASDSQIGFHLLAEPGTTPLFRCLGLRNRLFRRDVVTRADLVGTGGELPAAIVDEVEYDDYLDKKPT